MDDRYVADDRFAADVKQAREAKRWTKKALADASSVSPRTIDHIERIIQSGDPRVFERVTVAKVADALGWPPQAIDDPALRTTGDLPSRVGRLEQQVADISGRVERIDTTVTQIDRVLRALRDTGPGEPPTLPGGP